jgi:hypothetical protein
VFKKPMSLGTTSPWAAETGARGFAEALGLNTGTAGSGENAIAIYVR